MTNCYVVEKDFPNSFLIFLPTEVTPQNGTIKALDICVQWKLPGLETLFSPSMLRVQKLKYEFSPCDIKLREGEVKGNTCGRECTQEKVREDN